MLYSDSSVGTLGLSHWLLGICPTITLDDIVNISVFIDDEEQTVIPGENVEIRTEENPDPPTGCVGLKFDFGLEEGQVMTVCFSLLTPHQVGPVNVCINGGQVTETGMTICGPICGTIEECDTVVEQEIGICVPVTVTPHVHVGAIDVTCCGEAQVSQTEIVQLQMFRFGFLHLLCKTESVRSCSYQIQCNGRTGTTCCNLWKLPAFIWYVPKKF